MTHGSPIGNEAFTLIWNKEITLPAVRFKEGFAGRGLNITPSQRAICIAAGGRPAVQPDDGDNQMNQKDEDIFGPIQ
jgi:hypothetical protein